MHPWEKWWDFDTQYSQFVFYCLLSFLYDIFEIVKNHNAS